MIIIGGLLLMAASLAAPQQDQAGPDQSTQTATVRRIAAITQLAAQEYRLGVSNGRVVAPAEVEEAGLFLQEARRTSATLPDEASQATAAQLDALIALVSATKSPDSLDAGIHRLATGLATRFGVTLDEAPAHPPSLARGGEVYRQNCVSCHGTLGAGDGPLAASLNPKPADLTDSAMAEQTLVDLYRRITIGVVNTAMPSFESKLSADDRWAVALYASTLHRPSAGPVFARVRKQLDSAYALARQGRRATAGPQTLDAYMTFEQVERELRAKHPDLAAEVEAAFAAFRQEATAAAVTPKLAASREHLLTALSHAELALGDRMSPANLFVQSFMILLREGLEAILIVGALLTFLAKMGASDRRRDVHRGILAAVFASLATAVALESFFRLGPTKQEALEGVTMLVATVVLFYVSYWLLSKMEVAKWNHFVKSRVHDALTSGSSFALASAAFLAVYREGFETILFYKALFFAAGDGASATAVVGGILAGSVIMVGIYIAINRFGIRLPLKPFFGVTSAFLYYTAFVFAGKGVAELQEGSLLPTTMISWGPRIPTLGIYPTVESLIAQGILLLLAIVALVWTFLLNPGKPIPTPTENSAGTPTEGGRRAQEVEALP